MVPEEKEMVRPLAQAPPRQERATSLQPTYEDTVPPDPEDDWQLDLDYDQD